jgi:hypothetical protein
MLRFWPLIALILLIALVARLFTVKSKPVALTRARLALLLMFTLWVGFMIGGWLTGFALNEVIGK